MFTIVFSRFALLRSLRIEGHLNSTLLAVSLVAPNKPSNSYHQHNCQQKQKRKEKKHARQHCPQRAKTESCEKASPLTRILTYTSLPLYIYIYYIYIYIYVYIYIYIYMRPNFDDPIRWTRSSENWRRRCSAAKTSWCPLLL